MSGINFWENWFTGRCQSPPLVSGRVRDSDVNNDEGIAETSGG